MLFSKRDECMNYCITTTLYLGYVIIISVTTQQNRNALQNQFRGFLLWLNVETVDCLSPVGSALPTPALWSGCLKGSRNGLAVVKSLNLTERLPKSCATVSQNIKIDGYVLDR